MDKTCLMYFITYLIISVIRSIIKELRYFTLSFKREKTLSKFINKNQRVVRLLRSNGVTEKDIKITMGSMFSCLENEYDNIK